MRNKLSFLILFAISALMSLFFIGCTSQPKGNMVYIDNKGEVLQSMNYSSKDIYDNIKDLVENYNKENANAISIVTKEGDSGNIVLKYSSMKPFGSINNVTVFNGTVGDSTIDGFSTDNVKFLDNDNKDIDIKDVYSHPEYKILIISGKIQKDGDKSEVEASKSNMDKADVVWFKLPGNIIYHTDNIAIDKEYATVFGDMNKLGYVIYK